MLSLTSITDALRARLAAAREEKARAETQARALLSRVSRREALHELRMEEQQVGADRAAKRRIEAVPAAVYRLSKNDPPRFDTATRMHYRDLP
jgi:hypothetical protein